MVGLRWGDHKVLRKASQRFNPYLVVFWKILGRALFCGPVNRKRLGRHPVRKGCAFPGMLSLFILGEATPRPLTTLLTRDLYLELSVLARDE